MPWNAERLTVACPAAKRTASHWGSVRWSAVRQRAWILTSASCSSMQAAGRASTAHRRARRAGRSGRTVSEDTAYAGGAVS